MRSGAWEPQLLKPAPHNEDWPPLVTTREKPVQHEDPAQSRNKINTMIKNLTSSLLTPLFEKTYLENFRKLQFFLQIPA